MKAKLGRRHVRAWKWVAFTNPARTDGALLHHWRRAADEAKEYPFARFNKVSYHPAVSLLGNRVSACQSAEYGRSQQDVQSYNCH